MRTLFVIGPDFIHWPLAFSKELHTQLPQSTFCGLVIAQKNPFYNMMESAHSPSFDALELLDRREQEWLKKTPSAEKLASYASLLGENIINDLIVADRYLGNQYVTGAKTMKTPLTVFGLNRENQLAYIEGLLDFLFDFLHKNKPDIILMPAVASAPTLALHKVATHLGITCLILNATRLESYYVLDPSCYLDAPNLAALYKETIKNPDLVAEHLTRAQEKWDAFKAKPKAPEYWDYWYKFIRNAPSLKDSLALIYRALQRRPPEALVYPYPLSRLFFEWRRYFLYWYYQIKKNVFDDARALDGKKFIYFPLHYDPECSTMVLAPSYTNQLALVEQLSKSIPHDCVLAVKEHVPMLGLRPMDYYKTIKSLPNVKLISPFVSGFDMIQKACLTTVITGTAGFEALLLKKPTLCLGKIHYHALQSGFVLCENPNDLPAKIRQAMETPPASDQEIVTYLACILKESFICKSAYLGVDVTQEMVSREKDFVTSVCQKLMDAYHARKAN